MGPRLRSSHVSATQSSSSCSACTRPVHPRRHIPRPPPTLGRAGGLLARTRALVLCDAWALLMLTATPAHQYVAASRRWAVALSGRASPRLTSATTALRLQSGLAALRSLRPGAPSSLAHDREPDSTALRQDCAQSRRARQVVLSRRPCCLRRPFGCTQRLPAPLVSAATCDAKNGGVRGSQHERAAACGCGVPLVCARGPCGLSSRVPHAGAASVSAAGPSKSVAAIVAPVAFLLLTAIATLTICYCRSRSRSQRQAEYGARCTLSTPKQVAAVVVHVRAGSGHSGSHCSPKPAPKVRSRQLRGTEAFRLGLTGAATGACVWLPRRILHQRHSERARRRCCCCIAAVVSALSALGLPRALPSPVRRLPAPFRAIWRLPQRI